MIFVFYVYDTSIVLRVQNVKEDATPSSIKCCNINVWMIYLTTKKCLFVKQKSLWFLFLLLDTLVTSMRLATVQIVFLFSIQKKKQIQLFLRHSAIANKQQNNPDTDIYNNFKVIRKYSWSRSLSCIVNRN